ncbi:MAG: polyhydroxyalkanoate synthesis repressor PhaR [Burkholderiaceae bacterium]|jgi:polyhydroxyalkanoate synthesis repressor PhaR|nr:polyhydroxyalkanoate synthesis repressor PhaR [Burkholderiaceae bacterium]
MHSKDKKTRAGAAQPDTGRIIKKYPNRRLYDTDTSSYITLAQVRELVMSAEPFVVLDARTGEDLTRSILLQIILEAEAGGAPLFTEQMLSSIIRFYGHAMRSYMGPYLEKNIQAMAELQAQLADQAEHITPELWTRFLTLQSPLLQGLTGSYVEQSKNTFLQLQEQMRKNAEQMFGAFRISHT